MNCMKRMNQMNHMNHMYRTLLAAVALAFSSVTASAETITVCASGCDHTSINAAIGAASDGDVIQLAAETYFEGQQIDTLGKAITLRGVLDKTGGPLSVLDGAGSHRVLICESGETTATVFESLVIQNGYGQPEEVYGQYEIGGGMFNYASSPTLTNCTFTTNSAFGGGGMNNYQSSPTLTNCTFTSNSADYGGGMYNTSSSPILTDCTFTSNSATYGGGMYNYFSSPNLADCTFESNSANVNGGGMRNNSSSSPTLTDCTFTGNSAVERGRSFVDGGGNDYESWCDDCRADVNCRDDAVNAADLGILIGVWGTSDPQCDINGDGTVNAADLGILLGAWGPCQ
jgi:hypothetical protein